MSPFELVFALFGLLLGLAIAEVLGGFARVLKLSRSERAKVRIGWLTPLLGLFVILDLTSFWLLAWNMREMLQADYATLIVVLAIVGTYYVASTLIFPDDPEEWPDFDRHYDRHNRIVLGSMLAANVSVIVAAIAVAVLAPGLLDAQAQAQPQAGAGSDVDALLGLAGPVLIAVLLIAKSRRVNLILLLLLIGANLATIFV